MATEHIYLPAANTAQYFEKAEGSQHPVVVHAASGDRVIVTSIGQGSNPGGTASHPELWMSIHFNCGGAGEWHLSNTLNENLWTFT